MAVPFYSAERAKNAQEFLEAFRSGALVMQITPEDMDYQHALVREGKKRGDL